MGNTWHYAFPLIRWPKSVRSSISAALKSAVRESFRLPFAIDKIDQTGLFCQSRRQFLGGVILILSSQKSGRPILLGQVLFGSLLPIGILPSSDSFDLDNSDLPFYIFVSELLFQLKVYISIKLLFANLLTAFPLSCQIFSVKFTRFQKGALW